MDSIHVLGLTTCNCITSFLNNKYSHAHSYFYISLSIYVCCYCIEKVYVVCCCKYRITSSILLHHLSCDIKNRHHASVAYEPYSHQSVKITPTLIYKKLYCTFIMQMLNIRSISISYIKKEKITYKKQSHTFLCQFTKEKERGFPLLQRP